MKISANDIRPGNVLEHKDRLWGVVRTEHVKPGKGPAYQQVELKDLVDGTKLNERFRAVETVERVRLDEQEYQFLYEEDPQLHLMNQETFEQVAIDKALLGERLAFLQEGMAIMVQSYEGRSLMARLPETTVLEVVEADPVVKGQTAAASYKPAVLSNGVRIMVPPHIEAGTRVVVQHRREHLRRARQGLTAGGRRLSHHPDHRDSLMPIRSANINVMVQAAHKAARHLVRDFGEVENLQVSIKGPGDYVSAADHRAEQILHQELSRARPGFGFLMEESGALEGRDDQRWIVDPLDGTTNFLHGLPHFAISLALERAWRAGRGRRLRSDQGRAVLRREGGRRLSQRPPAAGIAPQRSRQQPDRHRHPRARLAGPRAGFRAAARRASRPRSRASAASAPPRSTSPISRPAGWTAFGSMA